MVTISPSLSLLPSSPLSLPPSLSLWLTSLDQLLGWLTVWCCLVLALFMCIVTAIYRRTNFKIMPKLHKKLIH